MTSSVAGAVIIGLCSYCLPIGNVQGCHAVTAPKPSSPVPTPIDSPEGDTEIEKLADHIIEIPNCDELIAPILANIPLQLLSYHIANKKGCNVDQPRNLAKSVTVE